MRNVTGDHYFSAEPTVRARRRPIEFTVHGREFRLVASSGVFSADRLDPGTAVLLRKAAPPSGRTLLDLGCGYGPIACYLAVTAADAQVFALDVNQRALALVRENAEALGVADRVHAVTAEDVPPDVVFDEIWSNPPVHVGKDELHALLAAWLPRLAPAGTVWLVIARHLGGDSLHRWLTEHGWTVERAASQKGFRVLRARR